MRKTNGGAGLVFLVPFIVAAVFVVMSRGTSAIGNISVYAIAGACIIASTAMHILAARRLYDFYDVYTPIYAYIPCVGELAVMDSRFSKIGFILYIVVAVLGGLMLVPFYKISSAFADVPFYLVLAILFVLFVIQIVKGIGLLNCMNNIEDEWKKHTNHSLGSIKNAMFFGFIPFVRCLTFYGLCKPLSSMTQFMGITAEDEEEEEFEEE